MICPYCKNEGNVEPRWDSDPHGNPMCDDCATLLEVQWKMCYPCNEYGLVERESGKWICVDCGDIVEATELGEQRVADTAGQGLPGQDM